MTCIVGISHKDVVWMGADSAGTDGHMNQRVRGDKKIFIKGDFLIGFCGSFRAGQLLTCNLEVPERQDGMDDFSFMVNDFIGAVKKCLEPMKEDDPESQRPNILVGYRGKLYTIEGDYQVGISNDGFDSIGSGSDIAMGSLHSTKGQAPKKRILTALEASAQNNAAVRGPFHVLKLEK